MRTFEITTRVIAQVDSERHPELETASDESLIGDAEEHMEMIVLRAFMGSMLVEGESIEVSARRLEWLEGIST